MTKLSLKTLVALLLLPTLLSATGLAGCCHGAAQDAQVGTPVELTPRVLKRTFEAPHVDTPITLDGKLDEPAWQASPCHQVSRYWSNEEPKTPGVMRVLWDSKYLYLGGEFREDLLYADLTEHDSHTWKNDAWEVFLRPSADETIYYEVHVTPANTTLDLRFPSREARSTSRRARRGNPGWNPPCSWTER